MMRALFLASAMLMTPAAHATDLIDAWQAAEKHDPTFLAASAARDAGMEARVQSKALKRPSVQAQGGYQYNVVNSNAQLPDDLLPVFTGTRSSSRASAGVQAVQPIYDASKRAQSTQLNEKAAAAEVQFAGEQQALILRVAQSYLDVLSAEDQLSSYQRQVDAAEEQRRGAQARFDAGRARITDVREAEAKRDAANAQRIAAEASLADAQAVFSELTGLSANDLQRPSAETRVPALTVSLDDVSQLAEKQSPAVQAAEHNARAIAAEIDRYGLAGRPVVEGVASYQGQYRLGGESGQGIIPDRIQTGSAGVRVTIPLYAGGAIKSKEREAISNAEKAAHDVDAAQRDARLQARKAWYAVTTGAQRVEALATARKSARLQQGAALTGRDVGIRTQTDVLNAQSQTISTDRDLNQAIYDTMLARLQLAAAVGQLGEAELAIENGRLTVKNAGRSAQLGTTSNFVVRGPYM